MNEMKTARTWASGLARLIRSRWPGGAAAILAVAIVVCVALAISHQLASAHLRAAVDAAGGAYWANAHAAPPSDPADLPAEYSVRVCRGDYQLRSPARELPLDDGPPTASGAASWAPQCWVGAARNVLVPISAQAVLAALTVALIFALRRLRFSDGAFGNTLRQTRRGLLTYLCICASGDWLITLFYANAGIAELVQAYMIDALVLNFAAVILWLALRGSATQGVTS